MKFTSDGKAQKLEMLKHKITYSHLRTLFLIPSVVWIIIFFVVPVILVLIFSFFERGVYGGVENHITLNNFSLIFDDLYYKTIIRTFLIAFLNATLCLLAGYPLACYISTRSNNKLKNTLLILVLLPFWTNFLIRTFSWMMILGNEGLINSILIKFQIINKPIELLYTPFAVQLGLLYNYLPFMVLPLYASIEKIDKNLYLASNDLGANSFKTFWNVTLPLSRSGILLGLFLVFIPSLGEFVTPDLLGGAKSPMLGNIIKDQFLTARNWPFGSALVFIIMMAILFALILRNKIFNLRTT